MAFHGCMVFHILEFNLIFLILDIWNMYDFALITGNAAIASVDKSLSEFLIISLVHTVLNRLLMNYF